MAAKKGYWIAHVRVTDPDPYAVYARMAPEAFKKHGANILARGGAFRFMEGDDGKARHVIIEFPSLQAAIDCYNSPEYQSAKSHRAGAGEAQILMLEGT